MSLLSLKLPPGIFRGATEFDSKGRYYDCNLIRFYGGLIRPWGGWRAKSTTGVTGRPRAAHAWKDTGGVSHLAIGCESNLFVMSRAGVLTDVTPVGLEAGYPYATAGGGYGSGLYGAGSYGTPRADNTLTLDATQWTLDNRGEGLIGTTWTDGKIYGWTPGDTNATQITNSPSSCRAVFMTPERFVMALGAGGDQRTAAWCDQEDDTDWTPSDTNQAGSFPLQTPGRLMLGKAARDYSLVLTDVDSWVANYIGFPLVYSFTNVGGDGTGAISQGCAVALDAQTVWMGQANFWACNGSFVEPLPCEVQDYVFGNINRQQQSIVTCSVNSDFGEIKWNYPSASSLEVDSYVVWNYRENHWTIGKLARLSGVDRGVFQYPLQLLTSGYVFEHEVGFSYTDGVPGPSPPIFLRSAPFQIGQGDNLAIATQLIPDESTTGAINVQFKARLYPQGPESTFGPFLASVVNDLRFEARQLEILYQPRTGTQDFRIGDVRMDIRQGSKR